MDPTKKLKEIVAHENLPPELIEEILSRVCPKSLVRCRSVCKQWKAILDEKTFINNHKETFRFIITTKSKIYSVSIDPKIIVRELTVDKGAAVDSPGLESQTKNLVNCDHFLICNMDKGAAVCNPWLEQSTWISQPSFNLYGIVHSDSNSRGEERAYKTIWGTNDKWKIHDFSSATWKDMKVVESCDSSNQRKKPLRLHSRSGASLNGTLFWIVFVDLLYCLITFDFSKEGFYRYCDLPCGKSHTYDALALNVFEGDRFSVLKQCHITKKIEIWVTKNKVNVVNGSGVVWMSLMTFSIPNFPGLVPIFYYHQPSYFIDNSKRLVVCFCDEIGKAWIYVMEENKLISKVHLDSVVDPWPLHCTYFPSLVPLPRGQRDEAKSQV